MILCAGRGTRLGALTRDVPKPMLQIAGAPLLEHTVRHLARLGFRDLIINLHHHPEVITSHFGGGERFGVSIDYLREEELLGTAGAVKNAAQLLGVHDRLLVIYGDVLCNEDYRDLVAAHAQNPRASCTIILHRRAGSNSVVEMDEGRRIVRFVERPPAALVPTLPSWVNSGLYCLDPAVLDRLPRGVAADFPRDVFPGLVEEGQLYGFPLRGYRCAVDSPRRYERAQAELRAVDLFASPGGGP
jgi:NDP-sugar pyrophosphorylase family protein